MSWLPSPAMILGGAALIFAFLYQSTSHNLDTTQELVASQKKTLAQQAGLIATMQEQDARNRKLMAEQQQREQQLRQRGEIYQRKYQDAIKNDECARRAAPVAVLDLLRGTDANTIGADHSVAP